MEKLDAQEIYDRYSVSAEQVEEWASKQTGLPKNAVVRAIRYLHDTKGIGRADQPFQIYGFIIPKEITPMVDVKPDNTYKIRGIAAAKTKSNSYNACPTCKKKLNEDSVCPKCGQEVEPVESTFEDWAIGDDSGEQGTTLICSFPPSIVGAGLDIDGKEVTLAGQYQVTEYNGMKQERFNVRKMINNSEVNVPPKSSSSMPKSKDKSASKKVTVKTPEEDKKAATEALSNMLKAFDIIEMENIVTWHKQNGFTTPLQELIMAIGANVKDGKVSLK